MVQEKSSVEALEKLREIGVVHLEKKDIPVDSNSCAHKCKAKVEESLGLISEFKLPKQAEKRTSNLADKNGKPTVEMRKKPVGIHRGRRASDIFGTEDEVPFSLNAVRAARRPYLPDLMISFGRQRKKLKEQNIVLGREVTRIQEWGDFDPSIVQSIISYGVPVYFYEVSPDVLLKLDKDIKYIKVKNEKSKDKSIVRIVVFYEKLNGINPFQLPEKRLSELKQELEQNEIFLQEVEDKLKGFSNRRNALNKEMENIETELEFEAAVAGMQKVDVDSQIITSSGGISYLTGFVPKDDLEKIKQAAKENNWAFSAYEPDKNDLPPTKIKSNSFVRLIHPLFSFLGTFPGYREFDISPSYLIFFCLFFAMILGDAGYGLFMFSVALLLGIIGKKKSGSFPDLAKLLMILTFTTIVWGAINGSWFQIPHNELPGFLRVLILPAFNNMGPVVEFPAFMQNIFKLPAEVPVDEFKTRWYIQFLCFSIALVQLVWARAKRIKKQLPNLSAVAQFGTLIMMAGLYFLVLNMLLGIELPEFALYLVITGVALNLVFEQQNGGNFFVNLGKGFGNFFQLFLKIISCFSDIISYIRLFAVGLAGAMIAQIFNDMAFPAEGFGEFGVGFLIQLLMTVLILVAGHALNLALTALSVIVHGVRLNLLEYAGNHLEMEWSGYLYNPFSLKRKGK
jgi:V/A-type H+-transporting ATPase subunit I